MPFGRPVRPGFLRRASRQQERDGADHKSAGETGQGQKAEGVLQVGQQGHVVPQEPRIGKEHEERDERGPLKKEQVLPDRTPRSMP